MTENKKEMWTINIETAASRVASEPDSAYRAVAALCVYDYSGLPVYGGYGCYRGEERGIKNKKP